MRRSPPFWVLVSPIYGVRVIDDSSPSWSNFRSDKYESRTGELMIRHNRVYILCRNKRDSWIFFVRTKKRWLISLSKMGQILYVSEIVIHNWLYTLVKDEKPSATKFRFIRHTTFKDWIQFFFFWWHWIDIVRIYWILKFRVR